jgi:hypothetical protein
MSRPTLGLPAIVSLLVTVASATFAQVNTGGVAPEDLRASDQPNVIVVGDALGVTLDTTGSESPKIVMPVDGHGMVELPKLGRVHVGGKSLEEVSRFLKEHNLVGRVESARLARRCHRVAGAIHAKESSPEIARPDLRLFDVLDATDGLYEDATGIIVYRFAPPDGTAASRGHRRISIPIEAVLGREPSVNLVIRQWDIIFVTSEAKPALNIPARDDAVAASRRLTWGLPADEALREVLRDDEILFMPHRLAMRTKPYTLRQALADSGMTPREQNALVLLRFDEAGDARPRAFAMADVVAGRADEELHARDFVCVMQPDQAAEVTRSVQKSYQWPLRLEYELKGHVQMAGTYQWKSEGLGLSHLISAAGPQVGNLAEERVVILRGPRNVAPRERIEVSLADLLAGTVDDIHPLPGDRVYVGIEVPPEDLEPQTGDPDHLVIEPAQSTTRPSK